MFYKTPFSDKPYPTSISFQTYHKDRTYIVILMIFKFFRTFLWQQSFIHSSFSSKFELKCPKSESQNLIDMKFKTRLVVGASI